MTRLVALGLNKGHNYQLYMHVTPYTNKVALGIFEPSDTQASKVAH